MERVPWGQPPSKKGDTMTTMEIKARLVDVKRQIAEIVNLGLADSLEARLENLVEEARTLEEQLSK